LKIICYKLYIINIEGVDMMSNLAIFVIVIIVAAFLLIIGALLTLESDDPYAGPNEELAKCNKKRE